MTAIGSSNGRRRLGDSTTLIHRVSDYPTTARRRQARPLALASARPGPKSSAARSQQLRALARPTVPYTDQAAAIRLAKAPRLASMPRQWPDYRSRRPRYNPVPVPLPHPPAPGSSLLRLTTSPPGASGAVSAHVETTLPVTSLQDEFRRLRRDQTRWTRRFRRQVLPPARTRGQRVRRRAILALPLVLFAAVGVILAPILYQSTRAYQQIFVDPVERVSLPILPAINPQGTPVLTTPTLEPSVGETAPETWDGTERVTLLLLGIDRREDEPSRSDTMILVSVDPVARTAAMLSIPRDLQLVVPGFGLQKMNAAYAFGEANDRTGGGAALAMQTVEANFGIRVDYFAEVDFQGFVKIVDTVGGLTLDVPYPIKDDWYPNGIGNQYTRLYFSAGWQHMDGVRALQYARTRNDDGDFSRARRQQQVLLALQDKAVDLDLLPKADELIVALGDSVRTDLSPSQAIRLARLGSQIPREQITQHSLLPALTVAEEDGPYYLVPDWTAVGDILSQFAGAPVTPPAAALAFADYDVPILVENGTANPGLAARVTDVLLANGFTDVTYALAADPGSHPRTAIVDSEGNVATAALVANLVGFGPDRIENRFPVPDSTGIVVLLGDDAFDPAGMMEPDGAESTTMTIPPDDGASPPEIVTGMSPADGMAGEEPAAMEEPGPADLSADPDQGAAVEEESLEADQTG